MLPEPSRTIAISVPGQDEGVGELPGKNKGSMCVPTHTHTQNTQTPCLQFSSGKKPGELLRMECSPSHPVPQDPVSLAVLELAL